MIDKNINKYANKLVNAFLNDKLITPLPTKYTKKLYAAQKLRKLCESKINKPLSGFKAAGTGISFLKKLNVACLRSFFNQIKIKSDCRIRVYAIFQGIMPIWHLKTKYFFYFIFPLFPQS